MQLWTSFLQLVLFSLPCGCRSMRTSNNSQKRTVSHQSTDIPPNKIKFDYINWIFKETCWGIHTSLGLFVRGVAKRATEWIRWYLLPVSKAYKQIFPVISFPYKISLTEPYKLSFFRYKFFLLKSYKIKDWKKQVNGLFDHEFAHTMSSVCSKNNGDRPRYPRNTHKPSAIAPGVPANFIFHF